MEQSKIGMEATEIKIRIASINSEMEELATRGRELHKEKLTYYWRISLCNSSDSFNEFKEKNPNHPLLDNCKVLRPENSGWKSDVIITILKCEITREDFIDFAKLIVSPYVGEEDFRNFEWQNKEH